MSSSTKTKKSKATKGQLPKTSATKSTVGTEEAILAVSSTLESNKVVKGRKNATVNKARGKPKGGSSVVAALVEVATVSSVTEAVEQEKVIIITS